MDAIMAQTESETKCENTHTKSATDECVQHETATAIPNRVFVGGIANSMNEHELFELFSTFGRVRTARIIVDKNGASKGYGFVTYESDNEAKWVQNEMPFVYFGERRLNVSAAIKKTISPKLQKINELPCVAKRILQHMVMTGQKGRDTVSSRARSNRRHMVLLSMHVPQEYHQSRNKTRVSCDWTRCGTPSCHVTSQQQVQQVQLPYLTPNLVPNGGVDRFSWVAGTSPVPQLCYLPAWHPGLHYLYHPSGFVFSLPPSAVNGGASLGVVDAPNSSTTHHYMSQFPPAQIPPEFAQMNSYNRAPPNNLVSL